MRSLSTYTWVLSDLIYFSNRTNHSHHLTLQETAATPAAPVQTSRPWNGTAEFYKSSIPVTTAPAQPSVPSFRAQPLAPARTSIVNAASTKPGSFFAAKAMKPAPQDGVKTQPVDQTRRLPSENQTHGLKTQFYPTSAPARVHVGTKPSMQHPLYPASDSSSPDGAEIGMKRRLGMGRGGTGYSNKKFKTPGG